MSKTVFGALPTPEDIRGARAWIGWTQGELGDHAGLSGTAIANIEKRRFNPTAANLQKIQQVFFDSDIEFLPGGGFKKRSDLVQFYEGNEGVKIFYNDLARVAEEKSIDILIYAVGEEELVQKLQNHSAFKTYRNRMLRTTGNKIYLLRGAVDKEHELATDRELRFLPVDKNYPELIYFIYDDKVTLITDQGVIKILTIKHDSFLELFRRQFKRYWQIAGRSEEIF